MSRGRENLPKVPSLVSCNPLDYIKKEGKTMKHEKLKSNENIGMQIVQEMIKSYEKAMQERERKKRK